MFVRMLKLPDAERAAVRRVQPEGGRPRRRAVPGRGEAADDRLVGADHQRVLLGDGGHRRHLHHRRRSGSPTRARSARRCWASSTSSTTTATSCRPERSAPSGSAAAYDVRVPQRPATRPPRRKDGRGYSTVGDVGYLDEDGYLYLTDRKAFMIISGGVNIYPQEAENVLINHPKVIDVGGHRRSRPGDGRGGEGRRATVSMGRRRAGARGGAHRSTADSSSPPTSARARSTSTPSCPASTPASSTRSSSGHGIGPPAGKCEPSAVDRA